MSTFSLLVIFSVTSCEDTNVSRVGISVIPKVPVIGDFEFETDEATIIPNWFAYGLSFKNPTAQRLIIKKVTVTFAIGSGDFQGETQLTSHPSLNANYFIDIDADTEGLEHEYLPSVGEVFTRYLDNLPPDPVASRNHNYRVKMVFEGFFTNDTSSSTTPLPAERFEKTIRFRTKRSD